MFMWVSDMWLIWANEHEYEGNLVLLHYRKNKTLSCLQVALDDVANSW